MTPDSLDNFLRTLTPHEQQYRDHTGYYDFSFLPVVKRCGKKAYLMSDSSPDLIYGSLHIKKQSRFQPCPMHVHNWLEINYMYSGRCFQVINDTSYCLEKGQVVLIDTDTPHSVEELGYDDIMISLLIGKQYLNNNFFNRFSQDSILTSFFINAINQTASHNNYILFHSENNRKIPLFFSELLCEMHSPSITGSDIINSLVTLFLCELINVYGKDLNHQNMERNQSSVIPILRYIEANCKSCTLESTARFFNMNPNYLTTLLKKQTGSSYKELVQSQKLARAGQLLRNTQLSVTEAANLAGYENISFFYKKFYEKYHCSPKEYRLQNM